MRSVLLALLVMLGTIKPLDEAAALFTIVDGDTVILGSERIRLSNIDAPEVRNAQCEAESHLGRRASERLRFLLAQGAASIRREGQDRFGRTLARISVNGRDVGDRLVAEGLARTWDGRRQPWC